MTSCVVIVTSIIVAMAGRIQNVLKELFSNNLLRRDEDNLASVIEEYFCTDSDDDDDVNSTSDG